MGEAAGGKIPAADHAMPEPSSLAAIQETNRWVLSGLLLVVLLYLFSLVFDVFPPSVIEEPAHPPVILALPDPSGPPPFTPPAVAVLPFVFLLLAIAFFPLIRGIDRWWHSNRNRFLLASLLGMLTLSCYFFLHPGGIANHFTHLERTAPGLQTVAAVFSNAIFTEYIPFIVLLFSLYVISGGINLRGDLPAHPGTNCAFLAIGSVLASFVGTTGAAMVLIRPLIATNAQRKYKVHTIVFFIFTVCNCGGLLLPIGDPPLFLGYLRGVPFTWTLRLFPYWLGVNLFLLILYYLWDRRVYRNEAIRDLVRDESLIRPLRLTGTFNLVYLLGVVLAVALVVPGEPVTGTTLVPPVFFRELVMLLMVAFSLITTSTECRFWNQFNYHAIVEVAVLFFGIFICMQVPIEILHVKGAALGIDTPQKFFWTTGLLSSFLDNAPTYVVFFETAASLPPRSGVQMLELIGGGTIMEHLLIAISLGAVFMGANTYIGNGPNFMVKSIAEQSGIRMPSFLGFMIYSTLILIPLFFVVSLFL